jgi:mutator protein MutT
MSGKPKPLPVIACGVAIIRRQRQFLIAQRNQADTFGSYWEFPGGKRHAGETFEQCIEREIKEELGIQVRPERKFMELKRQVNDKIIWLNFYLCSHLSGEPKALECQRFMWADVTELKNFHFPPANEFVINDLVKQFAGPGPS